MSARDEKRGEQTGRQPRWPAVYTWTLVIAGIIALPSIFSLLMWLCFWSCQIGLQEKDTVIYKNGVLKISAPDISEGKYIACVISPRPSQQAGALRRAGVVMDHGALDYEGQQFQILCQESVSVEDFTNEYQGIRRESTWSIGKHIDESAKRLIEGNKAAVVILTEDSAFYFPISK